MSLDSLLHSGSRETEVNHTAPPPGCSCFLIDRTHLDIHPMYSRITCKAAVGCPSQHFEKAGTLVPLVYLECASLGEGV